MIVAQHPEFAQHGSFDHLRLGRLPKRDDPKTLLLENYLVEAKLPPVPSAFEIVSKVPSWPMYGNDRLGDCTLAAVGHMIQAWTASAGKPATPKEADVEAAYFATGDGTDDGRNELDVLNYCRHTGVGGDKIESYVAVNPRKHTHVHAAIYLFGGLYTGIGLPTSAQGQQVWDVVGDGKTGPSQWGSWGGHAVPYLGYDAHGVTLITWGAPLRATWRFHDAYTDEAYAVLSPDWLDAHGKSMQGFDLTALKADLSNLHR